MRGVGGVRKPIHQSWLAKGLGLGLLYWGFKGVQEEIPREEASTLQIGSVAFPPGQYTSPQLPPCRRLFDQDGHQDNSSLPYSLDLAPCDFWLFPKLRDCRYETIEEMKEAVTKVIDRLTQDDFHEAFQKLLERCNKCIAHTKKSLETYRMHLVYLIFTTFLGAFFFIHIVSILQKTWADLQKAFFGGISWRQLLILQLLSRLTWTVSSTETGIDTRLAKAWTAIDHMEVRPDR